MVRIRGAGAAAGLAGVAVLLASSTAAADEDCGKVKGPAKDLCEKGNDGGSGGGGGQAPEPEYLQDPLNSLGDGFAKAAAWTIDQLSAAVESTGDVDFTSKGFLRTYAVVFGASVFLTMLLWLWAAIKRALRGAPLTTAIGESIGYLWLTVLASAFTPLALYTVVAAVDSLTDAIGGPNEKYFEAFSSALRAEGEEGIGGGPIVKIIISLVCIVAAGVVWLEMTVRTALLYVGAALGTLVYSGLVDKELWGRVRRWAGIMSAIILIRPIIVIVLGLASAITSGETADDLGAIVSGLSILIIAIIASAMLFQMIPGMGDEIVAARRNAYDPASSRSSAAVMRPAGVMQQGINTHAARDAAARSQPAPSAQQSNTSSPAAGMSAHATRPAQRPAPAPGRTSPGSADPAENGGATGRRS